MVYHLLAKAPCPLIARGRGLSMLPSIWPGQWTKVSTAISDIRLGDIVLVWRNRQVQAHRVIKINDDVIHTKGDACLIGDPEVPQGQVLGKMTHVKFFRFWIPISLITSITRPIRWMGPGIRIAVSQLNTLFTPIYHYRPLFSDTQ